MDFQFLTENDDSLPIPPTASLPRAVLWICYVCRCLKILFPGFGNPIWDIIRLHLQIWLAPQLTSTTCPSTKTCSAHQDALIKGLKAENKDKRSKIVTLNRHSRSREAKFAELRKLLRLEKAKSASLEGKLSDHCSMEESFSLLVEIHDRTIAHQENLELSARRNERQMTAIKDMLSKQQMDLQELENANQNAFRLEESNMSMSTEIQSPKGQLQKKRDYREHRNPAEPAVVEQQGDQDLVKSLKALVGDLEAKLSDKTKEAEDLNTQLQKEKYSHEISRTRSSQHRRSNSASSNDSEILQDLAGHGDG